MSTPTEEGMVLPPFNRTWHDQKRYVSNLEQTNAALKAELDQVMSRAMSQRQEIERLRSALRFYAKGWHYAGVLSWPQDSQGYLVEPDYQRIMIEGGGVALLALRNLYIDWEKRGGEPAEIKGEK